VCPGVRGFAIGRHRRAWPSIGEHAADREVAGGGVVVQAVTVLLEDRQDRLHACAGLGGHRCRLTVTDGDRGQHLGGVDK